MRRGEKGICVVLMEGGGGRGEALVIFVDGQLIDQLNYSCIILNYNHDEVRYISVPVIIPPRIIAI